MAASILGRGRGPSTFMFPARDASVDENRDQNIGLHRRLFERKSTDQQRQKQDQRQHLRKGSTASKSGSQSPVARYILDRLTPNEDGAFGRRSLDSFAERLRRKQKQPDEEQKQPEEQKQLAQYRPQKPHWRGQKQTLRQSIGLPIMSNSTMTCNNFGSLPDAVQRKYFSSVERLRFAQESADLDHVDPLRSCPVNLSPSTSTFYSSTPSCPPTPKSRPDSKRNNTRHARLGSDLVTHGIAPDSFFRPGAITPDFYIQLPEKIQRRHLTSEEQDIVVKHRRKRFVPDPSDELAYEKVLSRLDGLDLDTISSPTSIRTHHFDQEELPQRPRSAGTMTTRAGTLSDGDRPSRNSIYDSFRWLDEDEELDLRLYLDDYHANLRSELPLDSKARRPSFRRHMSVSRLPFGAGADLCIRLTPQELSPTSDSFASPLSSPSLPPSPQPYSTPTLSAPPVQSRKSRTLSLITPKHVQELPSFDGPAAHYRDPNARLKLREYLSSAQKFDEAIEFGFPSMGDSDANIQTSFLADDDKSSVYSGEGTDAEPDSPKTPVVEEALAAPIKPAFTKQHVRMSTEPFASDLGASREMTLRMTLTRPDLRADEQQIYGWQRPPVTTPTPRKSYSVQRDAVPPLSEAELVARETISRKLDAIDMECQADERGVIRRIWKRVRRQ